jgi:hypothetical protein
MISSTFHSPPFFDIKENGINSSLFLKHLLQSGDYFASNPDINYIPHLDLSEA